MNNVIQLRGGLCGKVLGLKGGGGGGGRSGVLKKRN